MNDPTPTPEDDLIRRALQSEADGLQASDELLDRTMEAVRRPPVRTGRRLLAAAAIVAAVAIGAGVAVTRDDDQRQVQSAREPGTTSTTAETQDALEALGVLFPCRDGDVVRLSVMVGGRDATAVYTALQSDDRARDLTAASSDVVAVALGIPLGSVSADDVPSAFSATFATEDDELAVRSEVADLPGVIATSSTACPTDTVDSPDTDAERPTTVALVREDGVLVVADLETGEQRELYSHGDPRDTSREGGPYFIDWVELSPDGESVYFSTCCEPAVGTTYRIPTAGGEPTLVGQGAYPEVSPDGRYVATSGCQSLYVIDVDSGESTGLDLGESCVGQTAWSPDGHQLAAVSGQGTDVPPEVLLFSWDGTSLSPADTGKPDNPGSFVSWTPDGVLVMGSGEPVEDDRTLSQDLSYQWLLWVDEGGVVREQAFIGSGDRTPINGLPGALVADW